MEQYVRALTIAGFDGSGGAGIQADIKTFSALSCYAMSVLTALPVQNTTGVKNIYELPISCIAEQCEAIFEDIGVDAVKIGMLFNSKVIEAVSACLRKYRPKIVVVDPVMLAKSGHALLEEDAITALIELIFPLATVITPNIPEASGLLREDLSSEDSIIKGAKSLADLGPKSVLIKGGHSAGSDSKDLLYMNGSIEWFSSPRIKTINDHGTGCTLSAAIAAFLAHGHPIFDAVAKAKAYITGALKSGSEYKVGNGHGPVHHFYNLWQEEVGV